MRNRTLSSSQHAEDALPEELRHPTVLSLLQIAVAEDIDPEGDWKPGAYSPGRRDLTSEAVLQDDSLLEGRLIARENGTVAGLPVARALLRLVNPDTTFRPAVQEGERITAGETVATVGGPGKDLLAAERPALNLTGRLSGIATLTRRFVDAVSHTDTTILDTRKTLPGARRLDKYAVRQGGGENHRLGLFDQVLIKENHIDGAGSITEAIRRVREQYGSEYWVEVEVATLEELDEALAHAPDSILLDNMDLPTLRQAVERAEGAVELEASGNVTLDTVQSIAETGVDAISIGALTHSAPHFDLSFQVT